VQTDGHTTYVVGDVHGHLDELLGALADARLIDHEASWCGDDAHLWFLGDFVDRGPDGIGVIDLVMRLAKEAEKAGGRVESLLGNHEILLLGMHHFGDTEVPSDFGPRSFARSWVMNGGQVTDQEAVTDEHVDWLSTRPALARVGEHLLMHSDTVEYLMWGANVEEINDGIWEVLTGNDIVEWWEVWRRLTTRHAFRGPHGGEVAAQLLGVLGGCQVVHGHSVIADLLGVAPAQILAPFEYADGRALGVDGGVFVGGPCLVVPLPFNGTNGAEADSATEPDTEPDTEPEPEADPEAGLETEDELEDEPEADSDQSEDADSDAESDSEKDGEKASEKASEEDPDSEDDVDRDGE
jgi:hypothetical protein